jgi:hypothetical protein
LSAFLALFKITHWQQYLIMLVVLLLYPLITFIFSQLMTYNFMKRNVFFESSLILLLIFSGISLAITSKSRNHFKPFYNIFNQLFYISLIYSPLLVVAFLRDNTNIFHQNDYYSSYNDVSYVFTEPLPANVSKADFYQTLNRFYSEYWYHEYKRWIKILKYAGIIIFLVALPFFKELFVRQISLPKKS